MMRQHKWALWSGFLGATASCFVKMGVADDDSSPLLSCVQRCICGRPLAQAWLSDLDEVLLWGIHRVLGDLMIKYRINLMPFWRFLRTRVIEEVAVRFYLFEVDYCQLYIVLPVRVICVVAMLVTNAYMIASFLKGIQESGSVRGTSLSTATNFASSAIYGKLLWGEQMNRRWGFGFSCVLVGVLILSAETTTAAVAEEVEGATSCHDSNGKAPRAHSSYPDVRKRIKKLERTIDQLSSSKPATPPPPPEIYTKIRNRPAIAESEIIPGKTRNRPAIAESEIIPGKVASLRASFMNSNNCSSPVKTTPTARIHGSTPLIIHSPERDCVRTPIKLPSPPPCSPSRRTKKSLRPESALEQYYNFDNKALTSSPNLTNRSFVNECTLCDNPLFDKSTGNCRDAVADLSVRTCFHLFHSTCLKQTTKCYGNACPICEKPLAIWTASIQAAQLPGFWLELVENFLRTMKGAPKDDVTGKDKCVPAATVRAYLKDRDDLTEAQKVYIQDDPSGMNKGLQAALQWGGYMDYNTVPKGHVSFSNALRTRGIWKYDSKKDDLWLWEWGSIHPRQRCDQCQLIKRPLPIQCQGCYGSSEAAFYCSAICAKRDKQRHKQTCDAWKVHGPKQ